MVPQCNRRIKTRLAPELEADQKEYFRIVEDMLENGGSLIPDPNWLIGDDTSKPADTYDKDKALDVARSEEAYQARFSRMKALMFAWVGTLRPTQGKISKYRRFLEDNDPLGLWRANIEESPDAIPLLQADLGSIMDLNLLYAFAFSRERKVTRLLEVGGGYGRLAEAAFNIFGRSLKYVMVDAVPASLYYSSRYLTHTCPDARIGSFYDRERNNFDLSDYDIAIVPSWHFQRLNTSHYDICVNIESMQEMNQVHVDYYLNLFESVADDGATVYLSNARDYYFRGSFNYPKNWQKLFCTNTPRSWSRIHPTEIFRKTSHDCSRQNKAVDSAYHYGLGAESDPEEFIARTGWRRMIIPLSKGIAKTARLAARTLVASLLALAAGGWHRAQRNLTRVRER